MVRQAALMGTGILLVTIGVVGLAVARAAGVCIGSLPAGQNGGTPDGRPTETALGLLPLWLAIVGIVMLGRVTGRSGWARRWALVAAIPGMVMLYAASQSAAWTFTFSDVPRWMQIYGWNDLSEMAGEVGWPLFIMAGAMMLGRVAGACGWPSLRRACLMTAALAPLALVLEMVRITLNVVLFGWPASSTHSATMSAQVVLGTVNFLKLMVNLGAEVALSVIAVLTLLFWRREQPGAGGPWRQTP